jgi:ubiquinone/menaquinone biosynthesis C-methylase UbiE
LSQADSHANCKTELNRGMITDVAQIRKEVYLIVLSDFDYLMESDEEALRLDMKTEEGVVRQQALWAGLRQGMSVADVCCGSGKTTSVFHSIVGPEGTAVGIDGSMPRVSFAADRYGEEGINFVRKNIRDPLDDLGLFDFVWLRFVLEYFRSEAFDIVQNVSHIVKPGGILCLIDLDHNCLNHYGLSERLERTLADLISALEEKANFDPYAGRKLYSHLYNLDYCDIAAEVGAHHLIIGELKESDACNWLKKAEVAAKKIDYLFPDYPGGYDEFIAEFKKFFVDPGRFTYTPVISCRGVKPVSKTI